MDWDRAIERNRDALKRVLASLVAMAGLAGFTSPLARGEERFAKQTKSPGMGFSSERTPEVIAEGSDGAARRGKAEALAEPGEGYFHGRPTLPRHLHRAVLRLLRPAEAAARRLVIVAARGLVVELPPARTRKPKLKSAILRNGVGTGIVMPRTFPSQASPSRTAPRTLCMPLADSLPRWRRSRLAASGVPRISVPGFGAPFPVPVRRPPTPDDPIDGARLALRLAALASALDNLPREARRFARWKMRQNRGLVRRVGPLRPGRAPGLSAANRRRPGHEVHDVLSDLQWFAFKALERPDTS